MVNKGYDQYLRSKIMTASKADLTLMLYDGAIKFCNIAIMCIEKNDIPGGSGRSRESEGDCTRRKQDFGLHNGLIIS